VGELVEDNQQRIDEFRSEIDGLKLKGSSGEGEQKLLLVGVVLVVIGVVLALFGAIQVGNSGGSPADQRAYMAQGSFVGIALIIAGAALFVRYSLGRYLRFWIIRLTYESRANTDRIVNAIERASGLDVSEVPAMPVQPVPARTAAPAPAPVQRPAPQPPAAPQAAPHAAPVHQTPPMPQAPQAPQAVAPQQGSAPPPFLPPPPHG